MDFAAWLLAIVLGTGSPSTPIEASPSSPPCQAPAAAPAQPSSNESRRKPDNGFGEDIYNGF